MRPPGTHPSGKDRTASWRSQSSSSSTPISPASAISPARSRGWACRIRPPTRARLQSYGQPVCQIFVHDEGDRLGELHAWLERGGMRFPLIPYSSAPSIERVVEALHTYGAVGYLDWPCAHDRLCRTLALGAGKAEEIFRRNQAYARSRALVEVLTPREQEVLAGIFNGCTGKEIARDLGLSPRTVETYRANIFTKLDVRNAVEAVRLLAEKLPELDAEDLRYARLAGVEG